LTEKSGAIDDLDFDVSDVDAIDSFMEAAFSKIDPFDAEALYLINNAAVVAPLARIERASSHAIKTNLQVNLLAPMLLTSCFIRHAQRFACEKRVLNISSLSAKSILPGMSVYSAAKAGLDMFSKCAGAEHGADANAVKIVSVWPGSVDTSMQEEARLADAGSFPSAGLFDKIKERGLLVSPAAAAARIVALLLGDRFFQGTVVEDLGLFEDAQ
jgi:benzil reductase ((S)-benzoin forming)